MPARPRRRHQVTQCRRCGRGPLAPLTTIRRHNLRGHYPSPRRGLCSLCTYWVLRRGELDDYPPLTRSVDETMGDYRAWRAKLGDVAPDRDIAEAMDMSLAALKQAKNRARKRGLLPPYGGNHAR